MPKIKTMLDLFDLFDTSQVERNESAGAATKLASAIKSHYISRFKKDPSRDVYKKEHDLIRSALDYKGSWDDADQQTLKNRVRLERLLIKCHNKKVVYTDRKKIIYSAVELLKIIDDENF